MSLRYLGTMGRYKHDAMQPLKLYSTTKLDFLPLRDESSKFTKV